MLLAAGYASAASNAGVPPAVIAEHHGPITVTGDRTIYNSSNDSLIVRGHATMTQAATILTADEIELFRKEHVARAIGHVHLTDPEAQIWASRATINVRDETGALYDARIVAKQGTYHLQGKKIYKLEGQNYTIVKGFFTTCKCNSGAPDWSVAADRLHITLGSTGSARNASFSVLGHRVMTLPYFAFPADTNRHSGFLAPRTGVSGLRGFQYLQPYYWAINKSSDATVAFDAQTSQRIGGLAEYRLTNGVNDYLWVDGAFYNESIRSQANRQSDIVDNQIADPHIPVDRYGIIGMTRQQVMPHLTLYADTISVSDSLYLREMNVWTLSRGFGTNFGSMRDAISHFGMLYDYAGGFFGDGFARMQGLWHQDLIQAQSFALQQLPQLWVSGRRSLLGGLAYLDYDGEATYFWRAQGVHGWRFNANPRLTVPWRLGDYLYGYGTVGGYGTIYDTSGHKIKILQVGTNNLSYNNQLAIGPLTKGGLQTRWIPYAQTGVASLLQRVYGVDWGPIEKLKNTIEPFATYTWVPTVSQKDLPLFDSIDRVNARSLITYGVTTRLYARMTTESEPPPYYQENANAESGGAVAGGIKGAYGGQQSDMVNPTDTLTSYSGNTTVRELLEATVEQAYDTSHEINGNGLGLSDIQTLIRIFPSSVASLSSLVGYDPRSHPGISYANVAFNFQPWWNQPKNNLYMGKALVGSFLQVAYNYVRPSNAVQEGTSRNASEFITVRGYYDLFNRLGVYVAPNYDIAADKLLSAQYGVRIKSPSNCWAFDVGVIDSFNPNEVGVQVQLTLGGVGSIGQSPFGRNPFEQMGLVGQSTGVLPNY